MNLSYPCGEYFTAYTEGIQEGFAGIEIHAKSGNESTIVGRIIFWDACGQFFFDSCSGELPLPVLEAAIAEAKERIKTA